MASAPHTASLEIRLLPEQRERLEQAAQFEGLSVEDFVVKYADEAAIRTIQWHTSWSLEEKDRGVFVKTLFSPPAPIASDEAPDEVDLEPAERW
jgi:uncharacterized protein (DUF1778 family)